MTISRNWTPINESEPPNESILPMLDEWARQWCEIKTVMEEREFAREEAFENGDEPCFETDEELEEFKKQEHARILIEDAKIAVLEGLLETYGVRMMRPYEHWNEDERLMEYMETRYD